MNFNVSHSTISISQVLDISENKSFTEIRVIKIPLHVYIYMKRNAKSSPQKLLIEIELIHNF